MIGSFLTRGLVMIFGYAYPAYECYKTVEKNRPEIEQLRFWCQYWILVAVLTVFERFGDALISWVPMYSEFKLAFFIYLWNPKMQGTTYVYESFFKPYMAKHETEIDRNLLELRTRAGDIAAIYWQKAASYGQTRIFEILQYVAAQSTAGPRPSQQQTQPPGVRGRQPPSTPKRQASTAAETETEEPPSPTSSTSSNQHQQEVAQQVEPSKALKVAPTATASNTQKASALLQKVTAVQSPRAAAGITQKAIAVKPVEESTSESAPAELEAMQIEPSPSAANANSEPPKETVMDEAIRVTRGRLRKTRSSAKS
ncbi:TB2/DP1/HVA22-related protein [Dillenia turbinata]|uniref:HVA22-like protein n=1 Tax=Dillenia turbinata TaxID=194707 RepID=A0AAN8W557_9MAGN